MKLRQKEQKAKKLECSLTNLLRYTINHFLGFLFLTNSAFPNQRSLNTNSSYVIQFPEAVISQVVHVTDFISWSLSVHEFNLQCGQQHSTKMKGKCTYHVFDKCIHEICKFNLRKGLWVSIQILFTSLATYHCQNAELNLKKDRTLVHTSSK